MPGYYPEELLDEIKSSNDIVDVVSEYVKLKKSGRNYFGLCPFHTEKSPSFSVSAEKQIFHCFGCGTGGNVFHFIAKIENLEFVEAVKLLAERAKIPIDNIGNHVLQPEKVRLKEKIYEINIEAAKFFFDKLLHKENEIARMYLKKRGITADTIKKFGLGFSESKDNGLSNYLMQKGFEKDVIVEAGLAYEDGRNKLHDKFRGRVIFPIFDVRDKIIGFGGRVLDSGMPKYLNSPETMVFNKRKNLYGLNFAKKSSEKTAVIVEGYMDAISLYQYGLDNIVASLGTALTQEQARLLRKYFDEIIIAYDSDGPGQAAALRGLDMLSDMDIPVRIMKIYDAKDPDEFIRKKGVKPFKDAAHSAKSLVEFKIDILKGQFDLKETKGKIAFLNKMAGVLAKVQNNIERDAYIKSISKETEIGIDPIYAEVDRILFGNTKKLRINRATVLEGTSLNKNRNESNSKIHKAEKLLIALLSMNDYELFEFIKNRMSAEDFSSDLYKALAKKIYETYSQTKSMQSADILAKLESEEQISAYTEIAQNDYDFQDLYKVAIDLLNTIQREKLEERKKNILTRMKEINLECEEVEELENQLRDITSSLRNIKTGTDKYTQKGGV